MIYINMDDKNLNDKWKVHKINLIIPNILDFDNKPAKNNGIEVLAS